MRIVYVTMEYIEPHSLKVIDGGLANYLHKVTNTLAQKGHEIFVVVVYAPKNEEVLYNGIRVIYLSNKFKKTLFQKLTWPFTLSKKRRAIKEGFFGKNLSHLIQKINKEKKIDMIQYASCMGIGRCPEKDIPSCMRISSYAKLWQKYYGISNPADLAMEQSEYRNTPFLFGPSLHIANYIKQDLHLDKEIKIIETPYPPEVKNLDNTILDDLLKKIGPNSRYLLFFGTLGELKGGKVIANCIYEVLKQYPDLYFVIVGKNAAFTNNVNYLDFIKQNAKEHANRIIRYDSLSHPQLYPIIQRATGILMPSLTENFSNACVEAMRLRKLVIGTEENFSQLITDGENGFLSKVGDSNSLKEKIVELMQLPPERKETMEAKAFERTEVLSPDRICDQLLDYYRYVIAHWRNNK